MRLTQGQFSFLPDLSDDEINQITHLNAMKFFQYDPFKIRPREKCTARSR